MSFIRNKHPDSDRLRHIVLRTTAVLLASFSVFCVYVVHTTPELGFGEWIRVPLMASTVLAGLGTAWFIWE